MIQEIHTIQQSIEHDDMVIVYFSTNTCGACSIIRKKVGLILESYPIVKLYDVEGEKERKFAAKFQIFSFPVLILFVQGKETIRVGKNVDFLELERIIHRYAKYFSES